MRMRYVQFFKEESGFWQLLSIAATSVISFVAAVVLSRLLDPAEYGVYRYILAWTILSSFFTLSGANLAVTQSVLDGAEKTVIHVFKTRMMFGVIGSIFFFTLAGYYWMNGNTELALAFCVYAPFVILSEALTSYLSFITGKKWIRTGFLFEVCSNLVLLATTLIAAYAGLHVLGLLVVNFVTTCLMRLVGVVYVLKHVSLTSPTQPFTWYSAKLTLASSVETATQFVDKVIVFHFLGSVGLAFYIFAIIFVDQLREFLRMIIWKNIMLDNEAPLPVRFGSLGATVGVYAGLLFVSYASIAYLLYHVFFPTYVSVTGLSLIYGLSFFTAFMYLPMYRYQAERKTKMFGIHQISILVATVAGVGTGSAFFGLSGAVLGLLVAKVLAALSSHIIYVKKSDSRA